MRQNKNREGEERGAHMSREYGLVSTTLSDKTWTFARGLPPLASAVRDAAASRKESLIGLEQLSRVAARSERAANLSARGFTSLSRSGQGW